MALIVYNLGDSSWSTAAADRLSAAKLIHEKSLWVSQTGTIVAATTYIFSVKGIAAVGQSATIKSIRARIEEAIATGADRTVNVDLQRSANPAGAYASILAATIAFTNVSPLLRVWAPEPTLTTTVLGAGDTLRVVVTVAGAAGLQATGLLVEVILNPVDGS